MHAPTTVVGSKGSKKLKDAKANKRLAKAEERKSKRLQREMAVSVWFSIEVFYFVVACCPLFSYFISLLCVSFI